MIEGVVSKGVDSFKSCAGTPVVSYREFSLDLLKSNVEVNLSFEELNDLSLKGRN
jgi:hypothetical protein